MFSTDISYDEAASAIQKLDPAMRADYEENLSRLRKAETAYADEDGRQIIGYMDLAFQLECTTRELAATKSLLDQEHEKARAADDSLHHILLVLCGFWSAILVFPLYSQLSFFASSGDCHSLYRRLSIRSRHFLRLWHHPAPQFHGSRFSLDEHRRSKSKAHFLCSSPFHHPFGCLCRGVFPSVKHNPPAGSY